MGRHPFTRFSRGRSSPKDDNQLGRTTLPEYPKGQPEVTILKITVPKGVLKAGDAIAEVVDQWHFGANTGDEPTEILVFYAGVKDKPITVK